jgi:hypothetical protein
MDPKPLPPPDEERRRRQIRKTPIRGICDHCGGPMALRVKGRDRRIVCDSCHLPPENCRCRPKPAR